MAKHAPPLPWHNWISELQDLQPKELSAQIPGSCGSRFACTQHNSLCSCRPSTQVLPMMRLSDFAFLMGSLPFASSELQTPCGQPRSSLSKAMFLPHPQPRSRRTFDAGIPRSQLSPWGTLTLLYLTAPRFNLQHLGHCGRSKRGQAV